MDDGRDLTLAKAKELLEQLHPLLRDWAVVFLAGHTIMDMIEDQHGPGGAELIHALITPSKERRKLHTRQYIDEMKRRGVFASDEQAARFLMSDDGTRVRKLLGLSKVAAESLVRGLNPSRASRQKR